MADVQMITDGLTPPRRSRPIGGLQVLDELLAEAFQQKPTRVLIPAPIPAPVPDPVQSAVAVAGVATVPPVTPPMWAADP